MWLATQREDVRRPKECVVAMRWDERRILASRLAVGPACQQPPLCGRDERCRGLLSKARVGWVRVALELGERHVQQTGHRHGSVSDWLPMLISVVVTAARTSWEMLARPTG